MRRRDFLYMTGMGLGATMLPNSLMAKSISIEDALTPVDVQLKKRMADIALNAAPLDLAAFKAISAMRFFN